MLYRFGPENWLTWLMFAHTAITYIVALPIVYNATRHGYHHQGTEQRIHDEEMEVGLNIKKEELRALRIKNEVLETHLSFRRTSRTRVQWLDNDVKYLPKAKERLERMKQIADRVEEFQSECSEEEALAREFWELDKEIEVLKEKAFKERKTLLEKLPLSKQPNGILLDAFLSEGGKTERRRGSRRQSPKMIHERSTSCDSEFCHRVWYTRSLPSSKDLQKRGIGPFKTIHEFHITPHDFDFDDEHSLNRRENPTLAPAPVNLLEDCQDSQRIGKVPLFMHFSVTDGGDWTSTEALAGLGEMDLSFLLATDFEEFGYDKIGEHRVSRLLHPDPSTKCLKYDVPEEENSDAKKLGAPAKIVGYVIDDKPPDDSGEKMILECEGMFGL